MLDLILAVISVVVIFALFIAANLIGIVLVPLGLFLIAFFIIWALIKDYRESRKDGDE